MKTFHIFSLLVLASLVISACGQSQPGADSPTSLPLPTDTEILPTDTKIPTRPIPTETPLAPSPTPFTTFGWSTTASTRTELSFAFPGQWDGSSPLTFGKGEFVKDPKQPIGVTFQIKLSGNPASLLNAWGTKAVGIVGIVTFTPETVTDGANVVIARVDTPTKIAQGKGITAQVAYIKRAKDVMEVMWFAPTEQWETLQPVFQEVLGNIEIWNKYVDSSLGLQTMYVHDWLAPQATKQDKGLWFRSADERTGMLLFVRNEVADPLQLLGEWSGERLASINLSGCTIGKGDRMKTMSGQWESKMGECTGADGKKVTYETAFVPDKNRLLEIIIYAPSDTWDDANARAFKHMLGLMVDIRP